MYGNILDLYTDYLLSSFRQVTSTNLSYLTNAEISHDKITRFLNTNDFTSKDLWKRSKKFVREIESDEGVLVIDDSLEEKPYTDENDIICWHFDHSKQRMVKGINFISSLYVNQTISIPINYEIIKKDVIYLDPKDNKEKRKSKVTKNEIFQKLLKLANQKHLKISYVLSDSWYSTKDNMNYIAKNLKKKFIMVLKSNRTIALNLNDKIKGNWIRIDSLTFKDKELKQIFISGVESPLLVAKEVFKNKDNSEGFHFLITNDLTISFSTITMTYQKRWKIEEFHKSLKQNVSLEMSPTKVERSQKNHFFSCMFGYVKLERIKKNIKMNHFAIKTKIYSAALRQAMNNFQELKFA